MARASLLEPLGVPAYRRYFVASVIASMCSWIFYTAQTWTFLESSGTAAAVAYLPVVLVVPVPMALIIGGALTDRRGPNTTLVLAQGLQAGTYGLVGLLHATGHLGFGATLASGLLLGIWSGLGSVPGSAILMRIVDRDLLQRAFALTLVMVGFGRLVGGPIGGWIVSELGGVPAFTLAACGTAIATVLYATLPRAQALEQAGPRLSRQDLGDALGWARIVPAALALIAIDATLAAVVYPYTAIVPVVARDLLGGGAAELGILISAGGVGALISGTILSPVARRLGQGRVVVSGILISAAGLVGMAVSHSVIASSIFAAVAAGASIGTSVTTNLLLQTMAPPRLRGRVLALDAVLWNLVNPASLLVLGLLVDRSGAAIGLLTMGALTLIAMTAIVLAHRPVLRLELRHHDETAPAPARRTSVAPTEL
jgi:MFS family permease